jgi:hypothetical protein
MIVTAHISLSASDRRSVGSLARAWAQACPLAAPLAAAPICYRSGLAISCLLRHIR